MLLVIKKYGFLLFTLLLCFNSLGQTNNKTIENTKETEKSYDSILLSYDSVLLKDKTFNGKIKDFDDSSQDAYTQQLKQINSIYFNSQDYQKAINTYIRSIIIQRTNYDKGSFSFSHLGWHLIEVGNSLFRLNDYRLAEYPFQLALKAFSFEQNKAGYEGVVTSLNNIGLCRLSLNNPRGALSVFTRTNTLSNILGESQRMFISKVYMSMCYTEMGNYSLSISLLTDSSNIKLVEKDCALDLFRLQHLGKNYMAEGKTEFALNTYKYIANVDAKPETFINICDACLTLSKYYYSIKDFSSAKAYGHRAESILNSFYDLNLQTKFDNILYKIYKDENNFQKALKYFESFNENNNYLNTIKIHEFIKDYNKKIEKIAISNEIEKIDGDRKRAESEKANQQRLSFFMIIITILILVIIFTGKGFEPKIQLIKDFFEKISFSEKMISTVVFLFYFILFYYFFTPVIHTFEIQQLCFIIRILPGLIAFFTLSFLILLMIYAEKKFLIISEENKYKIFIYFLIALFTLTILFESILFITFDLFSLNFLLSMSLIVLASFIVPFYALILVVERLLIKHMESMSKILTDNLAQTKQSFVPKEDSITILSEKTRGKVTFSVKDLIAIEAQGNYCMFYIMRKQVVVQKLLHTTMKSLEAQLSPYPQIVRCHKSFLVNIHQVSHVMGNSRGYTLHFSGDIDQIPISRGYQKNIMNIIQEFKEKL